MSVFQLIKSLLSGYGYPIEMDDYGGGAERYFVVMIDKTPSRFFNNKPTVERYSIMVHLVAPRSDDISGIESAVKAALFSNGFSWPSVVPAGDSKKWIQIFEFSCARSI